MALPTDLKVLNDLATTTMDDWFRDHIEDNFFTTNALVTRIIQLDGGSGQFVKIRGAGDQIRETFIYKGIQGGSYNGSTALPTGLDQVSTTGIFQWKGIYVPINFDEREVAQNSYNSELAFFDLVELIAETAQMSLLDLFGFKIYGSTQQADSTVIPNPAIDLSIDFDGLFNALDTAAFGHSPTYATYGGVTRSGTLGDPGFAVNANLLDAGGAPLSIPLLNAAYQQAVFNKSHPEVGLCRRDLWNQLYERSQAQDKNAPGPLRDVGFETIKFNGAEVIADDHQLPGVFDWLTPTAWHLWLLDGRDLVRRSSMYGFNGGFPLPNQSRTVDQLILDGNLTCNSCRLQTHIINLQQG